MARLKSWEQVRKLETAKTQWTPDLLKSKYMLPEWQQRANRIRKAEALVRKVRQVRKELSRLAPEAKNSTNLERYATHVLLVVRAEESGSPTYAEYRK